MTRKEWKAQLLGKRVKVEIYIYKVVISVRLSECPIIIYKPLTDLPQISDGNVLSLVLRFDWVNLYRGKQINRNLRPSAGKRRECPGQRWVLKQVLNVFVVVEELKLLDEMKEVHNNAMNCVVRLGNVHRLKGL